jgi:hypothetical protein
MKTSRKDSLLKGIPSWGLVLLTVIFAFVVLMLVGEIALVIFKIPEDNDAAALIFYILYNLIIAAGCFYICRQNPKSIWYVPLLCNIIGIISAIVEPTFWNTSLWMMICSGWLLSLLTSVLGARSGKRSAVSGIFLT